MGQGSCDPGCGISACGFPLIVKGSDRPLNVRLLSKTTGLPVDISAATEIIAAFLKEDNTTLEKKLSAAGIVVTSGPGGAFQVLLSAADTALLATGYGESFQSMEIKYTIAGKITIVLLKDSIQVAPPMFPIP